jgi:hypothetical protein
MVALVSLLGSGGAAICIAFLSQLSLDIAVAHATTYESRGSERKIAIGGILMVLVSVCLTIVAFLVVIASKSEKILQYRLAQYDEFNANVLQTSKLKKHRRSHQRYQVDTNSFALEAVASQSDDEFPHSAADGSIDIEPPRVAHLAFEMQGDEIRLGQADGVLVRSWPAPESEQPRPPPQSQASSIPGGRALKDPSSRKPHIFGVRQTTGRATDVREDDYDPVMPQSRSAVPAWEEFDIASNSGEST